MHSIPILRIICDSLLLVSIWLPVPILKYLVEPHQRGFFCHDETIRYPYRDSTISATVNHLIGNFFPILSIMAVEAYRASVLDPKVFGGGESLKPRYKLLGRPIPVYLSTLYTYFGYFYFGMVITLLLTEMGKFTVGRLRPHFITVCQPDVEILNCSIPNPLEYIRGEMLVCSGNQDKIREARLSFPSGHSSFSSYTMLFLILYLQSRMIWPVIGMLSKHVLQVIALSWTLETCMSRVNDFKHHWTDVVAGFFLGAAVAGLTAYHVAGLFRRPEFAFAQPSPFDSHNYSGAQLSAPLASDEGKSPDAAMNGTEMKKPSA